MIHIQIQMHPGCMKTETPPIRHEQQASVKVCLFEYSRQELVQILIIHGSFHTERMKCTFSESTITAFEIWCFPW